MCADDTICSSSPRGRGRQKRGRAGHAQWGRYLHPEQHDCETAAEKTGVLCSSWSHLPCCRSSRFLCRCLHCRTPCCVCAHPVSRSRGRRGLSEGLIHDQGAILESLFYWTRFHLQRHSCTTLCLMEALSGKKKRAARAQDRGHKNKATGWKHEHRVSPGFTPNNQNHI